MKPIDHSKLITEMEQALENILEDAIVRHFDTVSGETFEECILCGGWDDHVNFCPIGAIDKWVNSNISGS